MNLSILRMRANVLATVSHPPYPISGRSEDVSKLLARRKLYCRRHRNQKTVISTARDSIKSMPIANRCPPKANPTAGRMNTAELKTSRERFIDAKCCPASNIPRNVVVTNVNGRANDKTTNIAFASLELPAGIFKIWFVTIHQAAPAAAAAPIRPKAMFKTTESQNSGDKR
jgi:hypothetical protein